MGRGPTPTPTAIKEARGNPGKRPLPVNEPLAEAADPDSPPPDHLSEAAKEEWREWAPRLVKAAVLSELDTKALEQLCETSALLRRARAGLAATGSELLVSVHGQIVPSPWLQTVLKLQEEERKLLTAFGMTPGDRTKVTRTTAPKKQNPFSLLRGGAR